MDNKKMKEFGVIVYLIKAGMPSTHAVIQQLLHDANLTTEDLKNFMHSGGLDKEE